MRTVQSRLDNLNPIAGCIIGPLLGHQNTKQLKILDDLIPILQLALSAEILASNRTIEKFVQSLLLESVEQAQSSQRELQTHHEDLVTWRAEEDRPREISAEFELRERVFAWLLLVDSKPKYLAACQRQQPGTGQWLLESSEFTNWENSDESYLWLNASGS